MHWTSLRLKKAKAEAEAKAEATALVAAAAAKAAAKAAAAAAAAKAKAKAAQAAVEAKAEAEAEAKAKKRRREPAGDDATHGQATAPQLGAKKTKKCVKRNWTAEEDELLASVVREAGEGAVWDERRWEEVARGGACRPLLRRPLLPGPPSSPTRARLARPPSHACPPARPMALSLRRPSPKPGASMPPWRADGRPLHTGARGWGTEAALEG